MSKPKLKEESVVQLINQTNFQSTDSSDPISKTNLKVTIDQLQPYELNPRRQKNIK